jgi:CIC family chloride channel protein
MTETADHIEDRLADFTRDKRILLLSLSVTFADEILHDAVTMMVRHDIGRLPVVRRDNPQKIVGYLGRAIIMTARLRRHEEENHRESGWLQAFS